MQLLTIRACSDATRKPGRQTICVKLVLFPAGQLVKVGKLYRLIQWSRTDPAVGFMQANSRCNGGLSHDADATAFFDEGEGCGPVTNRPYQTAF